jgi:hypothetical protein
MRRLYFIIAILSCQLILDCSGKKEIEVIEVTEITEETVNAPEPPPPSFSCSSAVTLQEWFFKLCDTEKPEADTAAYEFGFFETDSCYAIYLINSKKHEKKDQATVPENDSEQPAEYYPLSKREYKDLEWKQALNKMKAQLAEFTKTEKFKNSSLAKTNAVTISFDDGDLIKIK